jgi:glycosyltransferase involved in cell wall biosynthesis
VAALSIIIPGRNEMFMARTVECVLANMRGDTEIIAVCDGFWPDPPIADHPKVNVIHFTEPVGQRRATNLGVRISGAKYVMKLDAHCTMDEGFDVKLMADCDGDWVVTPRLYNLHAFDWVCEKCGWRKYQGPTPEKCPTCESDQVVRDIKWAPRLKCRSDFYRFDTGLQFKYWQHYERRKEAKADIADTMSFLGACFFTTRRHFQRIGCMDEKHGSWGQFGTELACKSWLSGGRLVVNKKTWFSHMFRTQGGDFGFPYKISGNQIERARKYSQDLWQNNKWDKAVRKFDWILEHFYPVPDWHDEPKVKAA